MLTSVATPTDMPSTFARTMRSLQADGHRRSVLVLLVVAVLLGAWSVWFFAVRVGVYELSSAARLEVNQAVHPVEAQVAGRVVTIRLALGRQVRAGEILIQLDDETLRLQLAEERARLTALSAQLGPLRGELAAEEEATRKARVAGRAAVDESRAREREAAAAARFAGEQAKRLGKLEPGGLVAASDLERTRAEAEQRRSLANAARLSGDRVKWDQRLTASKSQAVLERLRRELAVAEGELATKRTTIARLEHEIEKHRIRAPVGGRLGEVVTLRAGAFVRQGDRLGTIVPEGKLRVVAQFLPEGALGRIQPGQRARLRLHGFPWTQFGTVAAQVATVASEVREGGVRVELAVRPDPASAIPLQHGLPGSVEVEVGRVTPAVLVLRAAGKLVGGEQPAGGGGEAGSGRAARAP
jgi:membrane fusion protein (multidrug efflux system)